MTGIRRVFRRLRKLDDPAVDRAMAAALPSADHESARLITFMLLERAEPDGLLALVMGFDKLPPEAQAAVIKHAAALDRATGRAWSTACTSAMTRSTGPSPSCARNNDATSSRSDGSSAQRFFRNVFHVAESRSCASSKRRLMCRH